MRKDLRQDQTSAEPSSRGPLQNDSEPDQGGTSKTGVAVPARSRRGQSKPDQGGDTKAGVSVPKDGEKK
jgi:hypothetical protein